MSKVIPFGQKGASPDLIFVCGCGCSSFNLRGDGQAQCTGCSDIMFGVEGGHWWVAPASPEMALVPPVSSALGNGDSGLFAERSIKRRAQSADWIILGTNAGSVSSWSRDFIETADQEEWLRRSAEKGVAMILEEKPK